MNFLIVLAVVAGIACGSPIAKRDAPYPAALPHSTYGEPLAPITPFFAPEPVRIETPAEEYGPPATIIEPEPEPIKFEAPAPPAPALPELPTLPETIIPHFPKVEAPAPAPLPALLSAPYPAPAEEYGPPPAIVRIEEAKPEAIVPPTPAEEYGPPPATTFIAPPAPALPALPHLPENIIPHFPKVEEPAPAPVVYAPYPAPAEEYGPPPAIVRIEEAKPEAIVPPTPAEEYGPPPATSFIAPPAPALPELPRLPEIIIPHIPETPKIEEAPLPVVSIFSAPYPAPIPHEEYGPPSTAPPTTTTTTTTTTPAPPTGIYPAAGPISHYGDIIQKSTPFFIRVNGQKKGFSFVEIGGQVVARDNTLLVDEGSFTYYDNYANPTHVKYRTQN